MRGLMAGLLVLAALAAPAHAEPPPPDPTPTPAPTYRLNNPDEPAAGRPRPTVQNLPPTPRPVGEPLKLTSDQLIVEVDPAFPRVLRYTDRAGGAHLGGARAVPAVVLNGQPYETTVTARGHDTSTARYVLKFQQLPGVELDAAIWVKGRVTGFSIEAVRDTEAFRVQTVDLPGHDLVSVSSDQPGAATAFTRLDPNSTRTADVFTALTDRTPADPAPVGATYGIVSTSRLAAAVETNSTYDLPAGPTDKDAARLWHQARELPGGGIEVGVWSGQWTHRATGSPFTEDLPWPRSSSPPTPTATARWTGRTARSRSATSWSSRWAPSGPATAW
ncbi:hypothetical protein [Thermoactinospora rubra]|uniref:hypothetical protein n=1 Tax=Thermoactinospora rubra TaxID=1088767 RepID=UPI001F0AECAB|nr:hypothetical protein [Thermoactinospora rubra]